MCRLTENLRRVIASRRTRIAIAVTLALVVMVAVVALRRPGRLAFSHRLGIVRSRPFQVGVPAVASTDRTPAVVLSEVAGFGPWVQVFAYDDGGVIVERSGHSVERSEGSLGPDAVRQLARHIRDAIVRPELRRELVVSDGPTSMILVRVDDVWTVDRASGMSPSGVLTVGLMGGLGLDEHPWSRFFDAMTELTTLALHDVHPWVPATFDLCVYPADYAQEADPWPETLPVPPLDELLHRMPPCFVVAGAYEEILRARPRSPDTWAVARWGRKWQLTEQVHLPGDELVSKVLAQVRR